MNENTPCRELTAEQTDINFETRETINVSTVIVYLNEYLSEASVINSKYIKMTGL